MDKNERQELQDLRQKVQDLQTDNDVLTALLQDVWEKIGRAIAKR